MDHKYTWMSIYTATQKRIVSRGVETFNIEQNLMEELVLWVSNLSHFHACLK